jgi:hypothetical protein
MAVNDSDPSDRPPGDDHLTAILDSVVPAALGTARAGVEAAVVGQRRLLTRLVIAPTRAGRLKGSRRAITAVIVLLLLALLASALPPVGRVVVDVVFGGSLTLSAGARSWIDGVRICLEVLTVLCIGGGAYSEVVRRAVREKLHTFEADLQQRVSEDADRLERRTRESCDRILTVLGSAGRKPLHGTLRELVGESDRFGRKVLAQVPRHYDLFLMDQLARSFPGGILGLAAFALYLGVVVLKIVKLWAALGG